MFIKKCFFKQMFKNVFNVAVNIVKKNGNFL